MATKQLSAPPSMRMNVLILEETGVYSVWERRSSGAADEVAGD